MMYVDGTLCAVPSDQREAFTEYASRCAALFKRHGAIDVVDCWGDDVPEGKVTSMPAAVQCKPDETVVFSWITWASKAARDAAWVSLETDPELESLGFPYDGQRMIFGGFERIGPSEA